MHHPRRLWAAASWHAPSAPGATDKTTPGHARTDTPAYFTTTSLARDTIGIAEARPGAPYGWVGADVRIVRFAIGDEVGYGVVGEARGDGPAGAPAAQGGQVIAPLSGHPFGPGPDAIRLAGPAFRSTMSGCWRRYCPAR